MHQKKATDYSLQVPQRLVSTSQHLFSMEQCPSNEYCCRGQTEVPETRRKMMLGHGSHDAHTQNDMTYYNKKEYPRGNC